MLQMDSWVQGVMAPKGLLFPQGLQKYQGFYQVFV